MATLKNHPNHWLRDDAAKAFNKAEADHGKFIVNSAGRTVAEQQNAINRWNKGGAANRPPYLYRPAQPATASNHVKNGGVAIDIGDYRRFAAISRNYGFIHTYPDGDPVHFDYIGIAPAFKEVVSVKKYQTELIKLGYDLGVWGADGKKGAATIEALKRWQDNNGLVADGLFGTRSNAKMFPTKKATKVTTASFGRVDSVQKALKTNYPLYASRLVIDNIDGPATQAAVKEFQRRAGLKVDGIAGPVTRKALGI